MTYQLQVITKKGIITTETMTSGSTITDARNRCKTICTEGISVAQTSGIVSNGKHIYWSPYQIMYVYIIETP